MMTHAELLYSFLRCCDKKKSIQTSMPTTLITPACLPKPTYSRYCMYSTFPVQSSDLQKGGGRNPMRYT